MHTFTTHDFVGPDWPAFSVIHGLQDSTLRRRGLLQVDEEASFLEVVEPERMEEASASVGGGELVVAAVIPAAPDAASSGGGDGILVHVDVYRSLHQNEFPNDPGAPEPVLS